MVLGRRRERLEKKIEEAEEGKKKKIWTACPTSNLPAQHARALAGQVCHKLATCGGFCGLTSGLATALCGLILQPRTVHLGVPEPRKKFSCLW
jgi:hypothetical protein